LLALLQILASSQNDVGEVIWQGWKIILTKKDFLMAAVMVLRLVVLILVINLFSLSTSSKELTHGTEKLFKPLQRIGFPAHEIALILAIALRFIPLLAIEAERLVKAQASRGADFGKGRMGLFKRVYRMLPLFIPLFITALRRSETLILAMETRCYTGGKGRTQLIKFDYHASDAIAAGVVVIFASLVVISHFLKMDRQVWSWMAGK
jgi:energy-coupling factor transport system permease protein